MNIELSNKQFRRLLDLVYIGNWILNSTRGDQRFKDYDDVESLLFARAALEGMPALAELYQGEIIPSKAFVEGGIHEAIAEYENNVFFDILAHRTGIQTAQANAGSPIALQGSLLQKKGTSHGENVEHLLPGAGTEGTAAQGLRVPARHVQGPAEAALSRALYVRRA